MKAISIEELRELQAQTGTGRKKASREDPVQLAILDRLQGPLHEGERYRPLGILPDDAIVHFSPNEQTAKDQKEAAIRQARYKRMGLYAGWSDLTIVHVRRIIWLEVKAPGGIVSDPQRRFREQLLAWGWPHAIVRSADEAEAAVRAAGFPCRDLVSGPSMTQSTKGACQPHGAGQRPHG